MLTRYVNTASAGGGDGSTNGTGSGGTNAFASLNAAFTWLNANFVTFDVDNYEINDAVTIYCEGSAADTSTVLQTQWNFRTTPTKNILITCSAGNRHAGSWDTSKYRLVQTDSNVIYNNLAAHVTLEYIQVEVIGTTNTGADYVALRLATANNDVSKGAADHKYIKCIVKTSRSSGVTAKPVGFIDSDPASGTVARINCLVFSTGVSTTAGYSGFASDGSTWAASNLTNYNCTVYGTQFGVLDTGKNKNVLAASCTVECFTATSSTGSNNNASSDGSAVGSNSRINQTFTFVNTGSNDFHLQSSDAGAKGFGATDPGSGLYNDDIDGERRSAPWDIGADQLLTMPIGIAAHPLILVTANAPSMRDLLNIKSWF